MKHKQWIWGLLILVLLSFACNYPGASTEPTSTPDKITQIAQTVYAQMTSVVLTQGTPTLVFPTPIMATLPPTVTLGAQATPLPASTATPIPCNWAQFISETIPDNTQIQAGTGFVKSWRLKNIGTCTWTSAYQLVFVTGDAMGAATASALTSITIPPGGTADVSVSLTAPANPGSYQGFFKLRAPDGTIFGLGDGASGAFWVKINSLNTLLTATATVTTTSSPQADLQITAITFNPSSPTHGSSAHVSVAVYNAGSASTSGAFTVKWWGYDGDVNPGCSWVINDVISAHIGKVVECDYIYSAASAANSFTRATADSENTIPESNENNNELKVSVTVQ